MPRESETFDVCAADVVKRFDIPRSTLFYHMRRGQLKGLAEKRGRDWWVQGDAVAPFVEWYRSNTVGKGGGGARNRRDAA